MMEYKHKGEVIRFSEADDQWYWENEKSQSLKKIKQVIDNFQKEKFDQAPAFFKSGWHDQTYVEVTITSKAGPDSYWVRKSDGKRSKEFGRELFAHTEENKKIIKRLVEISKTKNKLNNESAGLNKNLERFKVTS